MGLRASMKLSRRPKAQSYVLPSLVQTIQRKAFWISPYTRVTCVLFLILFTSRANYGQHVCSESHEGVKEVERRCCLAEQPVPRPWLPLLSFALCIKLNSPKAHMFLVNPSFFLGSTFPLSASPPPPSPFVQAPLSQWSRYTSWTSFLFEFVIWNNRSAFLLCQMLVLRNRVLSEDYDHQKRNSVILYCKLGRSKNWGGFKYPKVFVRRVISIAD